MPPFQVSKSKPVKLRQLIAFNKWNIHKKVSNSITRLFLKWSHFARTCLWYLTGHMSIAHLEQTYSGYLLGFGGLEFNECKHPYCIKIQNLIVLYALRCIDQRLGWTPHKLRRSFVSINHSTIAIPASDYHTWVQSNTTEKLQITCAYHVCRNHTHTHTHTHAHA